MDKRTGENNLHKHIVVQCNNATKKRKEKKSILWFTAVETSLSDQHGSSVVWTLATVRLFAE